MAYEGCGHGHVYPNADGSVARCGGPAICSKCAADLAHKVGHVPEDSDNSGAEDRVQFSVDQHGDTVILVLAKPGKKAKSYHLSSGQASKLSAELLGASFAAALRS